jgi:hypothetical protein
MGFASPWWHERRAGGVTSHSGVAEGLRRHRPAFKLSLQVTNHRFPAEIAAVEEVMDEPASRQEVFTGGRRRPGAAEAQGRPALGRFRCG